MADVSALQQVISENIYPNSNREITANKMLAVFSSLTNLLEDTLINTGIVVDGPSVFNGLTTVNGIFSNSLGSNTYFRTSNIKGSNTLSLHNNNSPSTTNYFLSNSTTSSALNAPTSIELRIADVPKLVTNATGTQITGALVVTNGITVNTGKVMVGGNIEPIQTGTLYDLGNSVVPFGKIYSNSIIGSTGLMDLSTTSSGDIRFNTTQSNSEFVRFFGTTGNVVFKSKGGTSVDNGYKVDIIGSARANTLMLLNKFELVASSGVSSITGNITIISGAVLSSADNQNSIGSTTQNFAGLYARSTISNAKLNILSAKTFGTYFGFNEIDNASFTNSYGGFFATTGNFFVQASGILPTDDTLYRLQVFGNAKVGGELNVTGGLSVSGQLSFYGISRLYGTLIVQGSIVPESPAVQSLGDDTIGFALVSARRFMSIYDTMILSSSSDIVFRFNATSNIFARFTSTAGNLILQTLGSAATDSGERLQVNGTAKITGNLIVPTIMVSSLQTFADNTEAAALPTNALYKTPLGEVRIKV